MSQWMPGSKGNSITSLGLDSTCFQDHPGNKRVLFHLQLCRPMQGWCERLPSSHGEPPCCIHCPPPLVSTGKPGWTCGSSARRVPSPCSCGPPGAVVVYPNLWAEKFPPFHFPLAGKTGSSFLCSYCQQQMQPHLYYPVSDPT